MDPAFLIHFRKGHAEHDPKCDVCVQARLRARPARRVHQESPGGEVSSDLSGPLPVSLNGNKYALVTVIRLSRHGFANPLPNKESQTVRDAMIDCKLDQRRLWRFHSDGGGEFKGEVDRWLRECGLVHTDTGGYRSQANGIAERRIQ
eukprot:3616742-Pyramimonas_sp.AAC.1